MFVSMIQSYWQFLPSLGALIMFTQARYGTFPPKLRGITPLSFEWWIFWALSCLPNVLGQNVACGAYLIAAVGTVPHHVCPVRGIFLRKGTLLLGPGFTRLSPRSMIIRGRASWFSMRIMRSETFGNLQSFSFNHMVQRWEKSTQETIVHLVQGCCLTSKNRLYTWVCLKMGPQWSSASWSLSKSFQMFMAIWVVPPFVSRRESWPRGSCNEAGHKAHGV